MKKYEVTDIPHPDDPRLHRIRALYSFRGDVRKGQLGGYVQSEDNLSQEGICWLFGDAIAMENAFVAQSAVMKDHATAMGYAHLMGKAVCEGHALICGFVIATGGLLTEECMAGENANVYSDERTGASPVLSGHAKIYGEVSGAVQCSGNAVVPPGMVLKNASQDAIIISQANFQNKAPRSQSPRSTAVSPCRDER